MPTLSRRILLPSTAFRVEIALLGQYAERVSFGGAVRNVSLAFVPEAKIGDHVVVHVGIAISVLDPDEARKILADIEGILVLGLTPRRGDDDE